MPDYYVNNTADANGDHEVHEHGCHKLSLAKSVTRLGWHLSCYGAVVQAKSIFPTADGCWHCSRLCHNR